MTRKSPIHFDGTGDVRRHPIQFVTVCTKNKRKILDNEHAHKALVEAWEKADAWLVGRYVVMPDHVHLFCAPAAHEPATLAKWIAYWKSQTSKSMPDSVSRPVWQKEYWDRILRTGDSYEKKWQYVLHNPVRAGLVKHATDWPYLGELNELRL